VRHVLDGEHHAAERDAVLGRQPGVDEVVADPLRGGPDVVLEVLAAGQGERNGRERERSAQSAAVAVAAAVRLASVHRLTVASG
jgi:hypothetical protein